MDWPDETVKRLRHTDFEIIKEPTPTTRAVSYSVTTNTSDEKASVMTGYNPPRKPEPIPKSKKKAGETKQCQ